MVNYFTRRRKWPCPRTSFVSKTVSFETVNILSKSICWKLRWYMKKKTSYSMHWMLWVSLYWNGISISAASAKAASFFPISVCSDIIDVKLTNCKIVRTRNYMERRFCWQFHFTPTKMFWPQRCGEKKKSKKEHCFGLLQLHKQRAIRDSTIFIFGRKWYLEIIKSPLGNVIIKLTHFIPWSISHTNQNYWKRIFTIYIILSQTDRCHK